MSRYAVGEPDILRIKSGPGTIKYEIECSGVAQALYSTQETNAIQREAMHRGGLAWISFFLPKRFTDYALTLGYRVSRKYQSRKYRIMDDPQPLIGIPVKGQTAKLFETSQKATAVATSTQKRHTLFIKVPTGHPIAAIVSSTLQTIPPNEVAFIAKEVGEQIIQIMKGSSESRSGKSRLSAEKRAHLGLKPRSTAGRRASSSRGRAA
jgi:hypothetical protein